ncbi:unnamed protein product [Caenorhabditis bovis]|uniref:DNA-directed RNA polymerase III subunit RPC9 n=1 Tax=Caenorhabditis bovis TaxID=2654633 RepID=A0A8S1EVF8_9PELO|nr:unnamed protein product [Caenorhabditis bovis]
MEVVKERVTVLTNFEVLSHLRNVKKEEGELPKNDRCKTLATIVYETQKYLNKSPAATQSEESIAQLIPKLRPFKLTGAETLQIINLRPSAPTDIQLLVEETEERFPDEEELNKLVETVTECLPAPVRKT